MISRLSFGSFLDGTVYHSLPTVELERIPRGRCRCPIVSSCVWSRSCTARHKTDLGWEPFLAELSDALGGQGAALVSHTLNRAGSVAAAARLDPAFIASYNQYFHIHDTFALSLRARPWTERSGVFTGDMLVSRAQLMRTEFGNDFGAAFDLTRMMTAIVHGRPDEAPSPATGVTVLRRERDLSFEDADRPLFQAVFPHLVRALEIRGHLRRAEQTERTLGGVFELLPTPAMVVDRRARVLRANGRAQQLLARRDGLLTSSGVLAAHTSNDTSRLQAACAAAARPHGQTTPPGATLALWRPLSMTPLRLIISPLTPAESPIGIEINGPCALVLVDEPDDRRGPNGALLRRLYGLTQAEAEIATRIAAGDGLDEIAEARRCSLQTVRWHNKRILSKMGCSSRRALVRQLTLSVASLATED